MDYYVLLASNGDFTINDEVLQKVKAGDFGGSRGCSMKSHYVDFKQNILTIHTALQFIGVSDTKNAEIVAQGRYLSKFIFDNPRILLNGQTLKGITTLKECLDLAQSHAYGMFCFYARKNNVPIEAIKVQPMEDMEIAIFGFLDSLKPV